MIRKRKFAITIFIMVTFLVRQGYANNQGRFNLQEGDWFEMRLNTPLNYNVTQSGGGVNLYSGDDNSDLTIWLRYELQEQLANDNQVLNLTIKRIQATTILANNDMRLGYDSYYPQYQDNLTSEDSFTQFEIEVNPEGGIVRFDSITGTPPTFKLLQIDTKKSNIAITLNFSLPNKIFEVYSSFILFLPAKGGSKTMNIPSFDEMSIQTVNRTVSDLFEQFQLIVNDSVEHKYSILRKERLAVKNEFASLVDASFPIPASTLIEGRLPAYANKKIAISLDGDSEEKYFTKKYFQTDDKGAFACPLFINQPYHLKFEVGNKEASFFIEPNDTLEIWKIEKHEWVDQTVFYPRSEEIGYLIESDNFGGDAAYNARLSTEMEELMPYLPMPDDVEDYNNFRKRIEKNIRLLFELYHGKASQKCIDYFKSKWHYFLAADKLYFADEWQMLTDPFQMNKNREYPAGFFAEIDTISTVMYPYKWCRYYQEYLHYALEFKQKKVAMSVGGTADDFYGNYFFSRAALKGYPLYKSLYKALDEEMRIGYEAAKKVEPFYQDFITNCNDPMFTVPLEKTHQTVSELAIGERFPMELFMKTDSTVFDLSKFKGKPVCLVVLRASPGRINHFKKEIEKFDTDELEFVFIVLPNTYMHSEADSALLARSNVHVINVPEQGITERTLFNKFSKIFVLDKWFRIAEDNVEDPASHPGSDRFEKAIIKGIQTKRFTKNQKALIFKTAGWSLGSILFTLLIGFWIYRIRIRRLKKQEAIQRKIKELEIKAIRSQMNPHFIFNALNSIQSMVNGKQYREANIYLAKFSVLLRSVLNNSERNMISLATELEALKLYCELEQLRFEFQYIIDVDPNINTELIEIPGMVIQPLAENAIVHGLSAAGTKGVLKVEIRRENGCLKVQVEDNGSGLNAIPDDTLSQKGYGLKLVRERLAMLNQNESRPQLNVENKPGGNGVLATLFIPID